MVSTCIPVDRPLGEFKHCDKWELTKSTDFRDSIKTIYMTKLKLFIAGIKTVYGIYIYGVSPSEPCVYGVHSGVMTHACGVCMLVRQLIVFSIEHGPLY